MHVQQQSSMPPQRQRNWLTTEELARVMGMLECGYSQRRVANVFGASQSVISRAWNRIQMYGSATSAILVADNEQPRQERTDFLWYRPDVIPS